MLTTEGLPRTSMEGVYDFGKVCENFLERKINTSMLLKLDFNDSDIVAKYTSLLIQESTNIFQEEYDENINREEKVDEELNKKNYGPTYVWGRAGTSTFNVQT
jgi:hypothetical protein